MAFLNALSELDTAATGSVAAAQAHPNKATVLELRPSFFRWREQWCVGIEALDRDHRALTAILNHIALRFGDHAEIDSDAPQARAMGKAVPWALRYWLDVLRERAREHFAREDALMRTTHYPDTAEHAGEHALMLAEYTAMVRDIIARGDARLRISDLEALKQWFMGHVLDMDKRLGRYLRENGVSVLHPHA
ncbi:MAG: hemerythrin domain-containing protein [Thiohalocapsa sp.]|jgi:hemerythrin